MLRKALLLSLLLHVLLLVALAHSINLPPTPRLPFMLELRVEQAASPGGGRPAAAALRQEAASPPHEPSLASRVAPAPQRVRPSVASAQATTRAEAAAQPPLPAQTLQKGEAVPPAAVHAGAAANGPGQAAAAGAGTAAANAAPAGETRATRLLSAPRPDYPPLARQLGEQGVAWLKLAVNEQGRVSAVTLLRSSGFSRLDKAAQAAVWQWRFSPQLDAGKAVASELELPVRFNLQETE